MYKISDYEYLNEFINENRWFVGSGYNIEYKVEGVFWNGEEENNAIIGKLLTLNWCWLELDIERNRDKKINEILR